MIPLGGNMFERQLEGGAEAGIQRRVRRGRDYELGIAEDYLVQSVAKFDGDLHSANGLHSVIRHDSSNVGEFLLDHVGGARHVQIAEMDALGVSLFRRAKRKLLGDGRTVRAQYASEQIKSAEQQRHDDRPGEKCHREAAPLCAVGTFARFHESPRALAAERQTLNQRLGQAAGAHAFLHRFDIVRHAPEFDGFVRHVRDHERGACVAVARLPN